MKRWTIAELHRLPDDGNRYELVRGELFMTPPPSYQHETIAATLHSLLAPYAQSNGLGRVYRPRAIVRVRPDSEVEPDVLVRPIAPPETTFEQAPGPLLVVEITSDSTRFRDYVKKKQFYLELRIPEYWVVDDETREVHVIRPEQGEVIATETLAWHPTAAADPLTIDLRRLFQEALG